MQACKEEVEGEAPVAQVGEVGEEVMGAEVFGGGGDRGFIAEGEEDGEEGVEGEEEPQEREFQRG